MSVGVGTHAYMAPEVERGGRYGAKVDVYSLGVIVVELWCPFATGHERLLALNGCKQGAVPGRMAAEHPVAARLAAACLQSDPEQRPSALEVRVTASHMRCARREV